MTHLPEDVRSVLRFFAFYIANGSLHIDEYGDLGDYRPALMECGSPLELVFAIFTNVLEVDPDGKVTNQGAATRRAAQYVRTYLDPGYTEVPPFQDWETELH